MTINLTKLKERAKADEQNEYDLRALNDYGMKEPPATVLELIAEIECHSLMNAEGCKPDFITPAYLVLVASTYIPLTDLHRTRIRRQHKAHTVEFEAGWKAREIRTMHLEANS